MTYYRFKNDFCKKLGPSLIRDKGQTHPGSNEIGRSLRKIQKIIPKVYTTIPGGLLFMWGVVPNFSFAVSVVA
jgi:hypothetical protein